MFPAYSVKARNSIFNTRNSSFKLDTQVLILETRYSIEHNTQCKRTKTNEKTRFKTVAYLPEKPLLGYL